MSDERTVLYPKSLVPGALLAASGESLASLKPLDSSIKLARCSMALMIIGVVSLVFGCGVLVTEVTAFLSDSGAGPFMLGGVLAWIFAVINGSLALRAACRKPAVNRHWANVNFGFGTTALIMHVLSAIAAAFSIELNSSGCIITCYTLPLASDTPRMVLCVLLCTADICQIVTCCTLLKHFNRQRASEAGSPQSERSDRSDRSEHITVVLVKSSDSQLGSVASYTMRADGTLLLDGNEAKNCRLIDVEPPSYPQL